MNMQSDEIGNVAAALAAAQAEMENAKLNRVNNHFNNKYADLAEIRNVTHAALKKHDLAVVQGQARDAQGHLVLRTTVYHKSGEWIVTSECPLPDLPERPQALGSAETYARRRSLAAACNISAEEDDDAEAAQAHAEEAVVNLVAAAGRKLKESKGDEAPDPAIGARNFANNALTFIAGLGSDPKKDGPKFEEWHKANLGKIARVKAYDDALHAKLVSAIHEKQAIFTPAGAG